VSALLEKEVVVNLSVKEVLFVVEASHQPEEVKDEEIGDLGC